ncbi:hypothetical protein AXF42_Ash007413 [Apostasia shenzhenica]|uniref:Uncharacterized protein n=1 Tax=Apostasia shenzhenica TaxID=1088818 RepID=A0A2I0BA48_9ASPA|nr:hypothetical protein AXF42_Ash007413 [Apostasia shenzhenica]
MAAVTPARKIVFLLLLLNFVFFPTSSSASFCLPMSRCFDVGGRRIPYYPSPPATNRQYSQFEPRTPPMIFANDLLFDRLRVLPLASAAVTIPDSIPLREAAAIPDNAPPRKVA